MSVPRELLPVENVVLDLEVSSKKRLFEKIAEIFSTNNNIDYDTVFQSLITREKLGSTGLGSGIAIPHGRISNLTSTLACFVKLKTPIDFESQDDKPVNLVFVVLVPNESNTEHLKILSFLAQKFSDKKIRDQLIQAQNPEDVINLIFED